MSETVDVTPLESQILCYQCAAVLPVEQGSQFVTCAYCGATNFIDKRGAVLHYAVRPTLDATTAESALRRWMGGNQTVKQLDQKASIERPSYKLFPLWMMRVEEKGQEKIILEPAAALGIFDLVEVNIPAADLEPYDHTLDGDAVTPTVPYDTVKMWLAQNRGIAEGAIKETSLVHLPVYEFKYGFGGESYTAVVDAATGKTFVNRFPSKPEAPYRGVAGAGCVLYFIAALIPLFFIGVDRPILGLLVYAVVAAIIAGPLFAAAARVSAKV